MFATGHLPEDLRWRAIIPHRFPAIFDGAARTDPVTVDVDVQQLDFAINDDWN